MAKKVTGLIKLQIPAGKANPAPPVGPALGQHGVNIMSFVNSLMLALKGRATRLFLSLLLFFKTDLLLLLQKLRRSAFF